MKPCFKKSNRECILYIKELGEESRIERGGEKTSLRSLTSSYLSVSLGSRQHMDLANKFVPVQLK